MFLFIFIHITYTIDRHIFECRVADLFITIITAFLLQSTLYVIVFQRMIYRMNLYTMLFESYESTI